MNKAVFDLDGDTWKRRIAPTKTFSELQSLVAKVVGIAAFRLAYVDPNKKSLQLQGQDGTLSNDHRKYFVLRFVSIPFVSFPLVSIFLTLIFPLFLVHHCRLDWVECLQDSEGMSTIELIVTSLAPAPQGTCSSHPLRQLPFLPFHFTSFPSSPFLPSFHFIDLDSFLNFIL